MSIVTTLSTAVILADPMVLFRALQEGNAVYISDLDRMIGPMSNPISIDAEDEDLSSLRKDRTGVDNTIWVSPKMGSHAPRIKIAIDPPDALTPGGKTATMTIQKPHVVTGEAVPTHVIRQAEAFIHRNHAVLLRFWNGEIDTGEMLDQIQKPPR
jgi:hypothetical protein